VNALDVLCAQLTRDLFAIAKFLLSQLGMSRSSYCHTIWYKKHTIVGLPDDEKKFENIFTRCTLYKNVRDRQTDGRTPHDNTS